MRLGFESPCRPLPAPARPRAYGASPSQSPGQQYRLIPAGTLLYAQGDECPGIHTVIEGWVFLHHILEDGRRQILDFLLPGDACGIAATEDGEATHSAEALSDTTVAVFPRAQLASALARDPEYAASVVLRAAGALSSAYETLTDAGRRTALEAVAHLLLRLDRRARAAVECPESEAISFPLTQEHIGDALGLTAVHVCRTLRALREERAAVVSRGQLRILDRRRLADIAGIGLVPGLASHRLDGRIAAGSRHGRA